MNQILFYPQILGLFLLGACFAKRKVLHDIAAKGSLLRKLAFVTGVAGFGLTFLPTILQWVGSTNSQALVERMEILRYLLGGPVLGLFYISALALLARNEMWAALMQPIAGVGKMAFTNYIMQSVICTFIFYGYGLGWYGQVGPAVGVLLCVAIFASQVLLSGVWLRFFRMGPLEWLWRAATYGAFVPLRKTDPRRVPIDVNVK